MDKITKYSLYSIGTIAVIVAGAAVYVSSVFDANTLKPKIETLVKTEKQRTLKFNGPLSLTLFPKPGIVLSDVSLSEQNSDQLFAHVANAKVVMQFWPLLSKKIVIDQVAIDGASINLLKDKTGQYNFANLLATNNAVPVENHQPVTPVVNSSAASDAVAPSFKLSHFSLAKSDIKYQDVKSGQQFALKDLSLFGDSLTTNGGEHIDFSSRLQSVSPALDVHIVTKLDRVNFDQKSGGVKLEGLQYAIDGKANSDTLKLTLSAPKLNIAGNKSDADMLLLSAQLDGPTHKADASLKLDGISGDNQQISVKTLKLDLAANQGNQSVKLTASSPVTYSVAAQNINLPQLTIHSDVSAGDIKSTPIELNGKLAAALNAQQISTAMKGAIDHNPLDFDANIKGFANPAVHFNVNAQSLDLNRYIAPNQKSAGNEQGTNNSANSASSSKIDLSGLNALNLDGKVTLGQLKYAAMDASDIRLAMNAQKGLISVPELSLKAFGGTIAATGTATATSNPKFTVKPAISGVDIYALLQQFAGFEKIEGKATVNGSLVTQGADTTALKNNLNGNMNVRVNDGAWRGINIAKTIRDAKAALSGMSGGEQAIAVNNVEKTDFTELTASILFNQGIATNKDLAMKSPLLRVSGDGEVNLRTDTIDYLLKAALVDSIKGQTGAERSQLSGVTVPIRIKGPIATPKYSLDLTAALKDNANAKLNEKKQELQQKLEQKAGGALSQGLKKLF